MARLMRRGRHLCTMQEPSSRAPVVAGMKARGRQKGCECPWDTQRYSETDSQVILTKSKRTITLKLWRIPSPNSAGSTNHSEHPRLWISIKHLLPALPSHALCNYPALLPNPMSGSTAHLPGAGWADHIRRTGHLDQPI